MKKTIRYITIFALAVLIAGCSPEGGKEDEEISSGETDEETGPATKEKTPKKTTKGLPPEPTLYEAGGKTFAPISASFSITADDAGSGVKSVEVSVDGSAYEPYEGPITFDEEGAHTVKFKATDYVGNVSLEETFSVTIDDTCPSTAHLINPEPVADGDERFVPPDCLITLTAIDNLSGVQKTVFSVDGKISKPCEAPISMPGPGAHVFTFRSQDNVGIWEAETAVTLVVDGNAPKTELKPSGPLFIREGEKWAPIDRKYYLSATDDVAGVKEINYSVDGGSFVSYSTPIELEPGTHKISYYAVDRAKNSEKVQTFYVNVDSASPGISLASKAE
jgi:hypothetical protein